MFEGFQKANPGVKLDVIGYPWAQMQQNLVLRLCLNQPLSVAQMQERWLPTFAALDNLVDLNDVQTARPTSSSRSTPACFGSARSAASNSGCRGPPARSAWSPISRC